MAVKYLLDNCLFQLGKKTFKQVVEITTELNSAPFFTNIFLYYCETKWIKKTKKRLK